MVGPYPWGTRRRAAEANLAAIVTVMMSVLITLPRGRRRSPALVPGGEFPETHALGYSVNRRAAPRLPMFTYVAEKVYKLPTW